jgi:hypothetical protein
MIQAEIVKIHMKPSDKYLERTADWCLANRGIALFPIFRVKLRWIILDDSKSSTASVGTKRDTFDHQHKAKRFTVYCEMRELHDFVWNYEYS